MVGRRQEEDEREGERGRSGSRMETRWRRGGGENREEMKEKSNRRQRRDRGGVEEDGGDERGR